MNLLAGSQVSDRCRLGYLFSKTLHICGAEVKWRSVIIYRGYSNFLLNMAFISPSEVENNYTS